MRLELTDLYRARWTDTIYEEWTRNVLKQRPDLKAEDLERTRSLMNAHVRDCLVTGFEHLIPPVEFPDAHDRDGVAAAIPAAPDPYGSKSYARTNKAVGLQHRVAKGTLRLRFVGSFQALPTHCNAEVRAGIVAKTRNVLSGQRPDAYDKGIQDQSGGAP